MRREWGRGVRRDMSWMETRMWAESTCILKHTVAILAIETVLKNVYTSSKDLILDELLQKVL